MSTTTTQNFSYARSLLEANLNPILIITKEGYITDMNSAFLTFVAKKASSVLGTSCYGYFTNTESVKTACNEIFEKGFISDYPLTITDHSKKDFLFDGYVYRDEDDAIIGAVLVARDVSKQKKIQHELTLSRKKAEKATRIAEEAVKSKQQFLSNMSHEIRTPMNSIIGFTKVILKTELTSKQKEYISAIKLSGDALIVLINDILDLAKVDSGKMVFEKIPFSLTSAISAMLHLFKTKIQEKNLTLHITFDPTIPEVVLGDPIRLHQIILNLVSNAVKFTKKGNITVQLKLLSEDSQTVTIEFAVIDTGIGIEATKINTIFENFQQVYSLSSRLYGGTGLGLAIVKQLVEAQNGSIQVQSTLNEGTTFSFVLEFGKTDEKIILEDEILLLDTEIKNINILVVEDIVLNQLLIRTLLDDFGFACDIAANGKLALDKIAAATTPYDIILMDLQMPEMNGFEATQYIRNTLKSKIPIIALTADVTTVDLTKCKAAGMNDYIAKPIDERLLYTKIIGLVKSKLTTLTPSANNRKEIVIAKHINLDYLKQLTEENPKLMGEMIEVYLEQTPPMLREMKQSVDQNDWQMLQEAVHKIVPSFFIMGIPYDMEILNHKMKEQENTSEITQEIQMLIIALEKSCLHAFAELKKELNTLKEMTP
ncbi:MAG: ATP-binding protein [Bacteroidota bacterium]